MPGVQPRHRSLTDRIDDWLEEHSPEVVGLYVRLALMAVVILVAVGRRHLGTIAVTVAFVGGGVVAIELLRRRHLARREFLRRNFMCLECGYDLRATPERCPECGTVPEPAATRESARESAPAP